AVSLHNPAILYQAKGDYAQAEPLLQRALQIGEQHLGPDHPEVAYHLNNLASLYHTKGDYAQAELLHRRALTIREQRLGPDHPAVAQSLKPPVSLGVTCALAYTYGSDDDRIWSVRCAVIVAGLDDRKSPCRAGTTPPAATGSARIALAVRSRPV